MDVIINKRKGKNQTQLYIIQSTSLIKIMDVILISSKNIIKPNSILH